MSDFSEKDFLDPLWYINFAPMLQEYFYAYKGKAEDPRDTTWMKRREHFVISLAQLLAEGKVTLGTSGPKLDKERLSIDTVVIHHSSTPDMTPYEVFNALGLIRLYTPVFSSPNNPKYKLPLWSGHFYQDKQTFVGYHYLIWPDGTWEQVLEDKYIGWHAGDWDINCRSIGICFVGDFTHGRPSNHALESAKTIIAKYPNTTILGHNEVLETTLCPGSLFLGKNNEGGWKQELV